MWWRLILGFILGGFLGILGAQLVTGILALLLGELHVLIWRPIEFFGFVSGGTLVARIVYKAARRSNQSPSG